MAQTNIFPIQLHNHYLLPKQHKVRQFTVMLVLLIFWGYGSAHAQREDEALYSFTGGLVGGINFSQVDGDGYKGYGKMGYTGGGILVLPFRNADLPFENTTIAMSLEVLFTQKGANGNRQILPDVLSQQINMQYAEVPVQIGLYRGPRKSGVMAGLSIGYLGFVEETIDRGNGVILRNALPFRKFDLNFVLTGNLHLWKGFFLSPRFQYSMISVRNNNGRFGGRNEQYNNVVALRLMYLFRRVDRY